LYNVEEHIGRNLSDLMLNKSFLDIVPKIQAAITKTKINWTSSNIKNIFDTKGL
jgi:hypothetical protein